MIKIDCWESTVSSCTGEPSSKEKQEATCQALLLPADLQLIPAEHGEAAPQRHAIFALPRAGK